MNIICSRVLFNNQATLYVLKSEELESNIGADRKASIGGIDGSQTGMTTVQVCDVPYVSVGLSNRKADAVIISWSKWIIRGIDPDYFKKYQTFVLYVCDTTKFIFSVDRERLYVCHTKGRLTQSLYA